MIREEMQVATLAILPQVVRWALMVGVLVLGGSILKSAGGVVHRALVV